MKLYLKSLKKSCQKYEINSVPVSIKQKSIFSDGENPGYALHGGTRREFCLIFFRLFVLMFSLNSI